MQLRDFLSTEAFTPVNKAIARKIGFTCAGFLGELIRQRDRFGQWEFYYSQSDMEEEIGLSAKVQRSCISILVKLGWLTVEKKGTPCRNYYVINDGQILFDYNIDINDGGKTGCDQMSQLDVTKGDNLIGQNVTTYNKKDNNKKENKNISNECFEEFWRLYPKKRKKNEARKKFIKINDLEIGKVMSGLNRYLDYWRKKGTEMQYIPDPTTWINQERRNDELETQQIAKRPVYQQIDINNLSLNDL